MYSLYIYRGLHALRGCKIPEGGGDVVTGAGVGEQAFILT